VPADVEVAAATGMIFTVISIVRSYVLRRVFEAIPGQI
jgi:hypothetical protein